MTSCLRMPATVFCLIRFARCKEWADYKAALALSVVCRRWKYRQTSLTDSIWTLAQSSLIKALKMAANTLSFIPVGENLTLPLSIFADMHSKWIMAVAMLTSSSRGMHLVWGAFVQRLNVKKRTSLHTRSLNKKKWRNLDANDDNR